MNDYIPVIIALIAGPTVAFITARMSRPKVIADAAKTYTDISLSLVEPQKTRIAELEKKMDGCQIRIKHLEDENNALHVWAKVLVAQVVEAGDTPIPFTFVVEGGP
ncbi:hypothetical protein ACFL0N_01725 [Pseudomonadota bacterium]